MSETPEAIKIMESNNNNNNNNININNTNNNVWNKNTNCADGVFKIKRKNKQSKVHSKKNDAIIILFSLW